MSKNTTSKFESLADASNKQEEPQVSKPKKEKIEEEKKPVEVKKIQLRRYETNLFGRRVS